MFENYTVAVRLRLINEVSAGLAAMGAQFRARSVEAEVLQKRLSSIRSMAMAGGGFLAVGGLGLYAFKAPIEEARKWQQEVAKFNSLGFGAMVNKDAQQFAVGMNTYGVSAVENMTLLSDAMAVFKDLNHSELAAPVMARMKFANEAVFGADTGTDNTRKFMDLMKVIEFRRGLSSKEEFERQANYAQKTITGSRGRVDQAALLQTLKTGGVGVSRLTNEAFYLGLEPIIQEFGGFRTGTGINAIYNNLVQARGSIASQQELMRLGLVDPKMVEYNSMGMVKKMRPGAFKGSDIFETEGPMALLQKVLLPAFAAHGITTEEQIVREMGQILSNSRGAGLLARVYQQAPTIQRMVDANRNAMDIDQLYNQGKKTPQGKQLDLEARYADAKREVGLAALPLLIKGMEMLTVLLRSFTLFAREHPMLVKTTVVLLGAVSAFALLGGIGLLAAAGVRGLWMAMTFGGGIIGKLADSFSMFVTRMVIKLATMTSMDTAFATGSSMAGNAARAAASQAAANTAASTTISVMGVLGAVSKLSLALGAGYAVGSLIWYFMEGTKAADKFGEGIARVMAFFGSDQAKESLAARGVDLNADQNRNIALVTFHDRSKSRNAQSSTSGASSPSTRPSPFVQPAGSTPLTVHTQVNIDGKRVAAGINKYLFGGVTGPQTGPSAFDGTMSIAPSGLGSGGGF